jgi:hypothetical protein
VLITGVDLGVITGQTGAGCRIFIYDVASATLKYVRGLPAGATLNLPVLSDDGRWLSFLSSRIVPAGFRQAFGALLDLQTGELLDPIGGITDSPTYDAVISGDASTIVLSTPADLDPRVGNGDHSFELFAYDVASGRFTQISDTTGGISGGQCESFRPSVSGNANVVVVTLPAMTVEPCHVALPQRNAVDNFFLHRVRAVRKRPGNHGPVFQPIGTARVVAGERLSLPLSATDPDGHPIVFFAQLIGGLSVPPGSTIEDHHDGTATFSWPTKLEQAGLYPMRLAAFDEGGGEVFQDVIIPVCSRLVHDGDSPGVVAALFQTEPPAPCRDADVNHDAVVTAADLVRAGAGGNVR